MTNFVRFSIGEAGAAPLEQLRLQQKRGGSATLQTMTTLLIMLQWCPTLLDYSARRIQLGLELPVGGPPRGNPRWDIQTPDILFVGAINHVPSSVVYPDQDWILFRIFVDPDPHM